MKYVFLTYFRILKRAPTTSLLSTVLEGVNRFVHLLNIEFFDDLIALTTQIVENKVLLVEIIYL